MSQPDFSSLFLRLDEVSPLSKINYAHQLLFMGSCFAEVVPTYLNELHFSATFNPMGIYFDPASLSKIVSTDFSIVEDHIVKTSDGDYVTLDGSSSFRCKTKEGLKDELIARHNALRSSISQAKHIFFTLGTAWVFRYKKTGKIISNCQKIPQTEFEKVLLSPESISDYLSTISQSIKEVNPNCQMVWTVSPVRHTKNGLFHNNVSKGHLLSSLYSHTIENKAEIYLPIYELVIDVLRDYRFYESDLIHPNSGAKDIVVKYFLDTFLDESSQGFLSETHELKNLRNHKIDPTRTEALNKHKNLIARKEQLFKERYKLQ